MFYLRLAVRKRIKNLAPRSAQNKHSPILRIAVASSINAKTRFAHWIAENTNNSYSQIAAAPSVNAKTENINVRF